MSCADCVIQETTAAAFLRGLRSSEKRRPWLPLAASIDLSSGCNLSCSHCFVHFPGAREAELSTRETMRVLDELAARGVLFLVVTGGEPLLRPDFRELYLHAKAAGFVLTLFTNATLIDDDMAAFLAAHPPRRVEATVYGHTRATYEAVTGVSGSFGRFRLGVDALLRHGVLLRLKTMVMTTNAHELEAIKAWAEGLGCDFRYDPIVHGRLNGDLAPTRFRLPPEAIVRLQFSNPADKAEFLEYVERLGPELGEKKTLLECGAGTMTLHVDAGGNAHPCMLWRSDPYSLLTQSLDERWFEHIRGVRNRAAPDGECRACPDRGLCNYCPPLAAIETGHPTKASPFYCQLAAERKTQCRL